MRKLKAAQLDGIRLFPGVAELLRALQARGIVTAIVSSDSEANVRRALGSHNAALIAHYACSAATFGKARKLARVLRAAGVAPGQALCVGDEIRDLEAARAVGIAFGAVAWGYTCPEALRKRAPDVVFASMGEILEAV